MKLWVMIEKDRESSRWARVRIFDNRRRFVIAMCATVPNLKGEDIPWDKASLPTFYGTVEMSQVEMEQ